MFSKKRQKQIKKLNKKAKKEVEREEAKEKKKGDDESWLRKIVKHFL